MAQTAGRHLRRNALETTVFMVLLAQVLAYNTDYYVPLTHVVSVVEKDGHRYMIEIDTDNNQPVNTGIAVYPTMSGEIAFGEYIPGKKTPINTLSEGEATVESGLFLLHTDFLVLERKQWTKATCDPLKFGSSTLMLFLEDTGSQGNTRKKHVGTYDGELDSYFYYDKYNKKSMEIPYLKAYIDEEKEGFRPQRFEIFCSTIIFDKTQP